MSEGITEKEERAYESGLKAGKIIVLRELKEWAGDRRKHEQTRMAKLIHTKEEETAYIRADSKDMAYEIVIDQIEELLEKP